MAERKKVEHPYDKSDPNKIHAFYEEIGRRGGSRVRELIEKGKQASRRER